MASRLDAKRMDAWLTLMRAHAAVVDALEEELQEQEGLALPWYEVLVHLDREPEGRMRMQELAHRVLLSKSGLSRLVDRMEQAGLVTRTSCPTDRRGTFAVITLEGRRALRRAAPTFAQGFHEHVARHLTDRDVAALRAALDKLIRANARD